VYFAGLNQYGELHYNSSDVRTFWLVVAVVAAISLIIVLGSRSRARRGADYKVSDCCIDCCCAECCTDLACGAFNCCTVSSLSMFVIGVVALWGGGLAAAAWLVLSLVRQ
jgi:hypothetical protein